MFMVRLPPLPLLKITGLCWATVFDEQSVLVCLSLFTTLSVFLTKSPRKQESSAVIIGSVVCTLFHSGHSFFQTVNYKKEV